MSSKSLYEEYSSANPTRLLDQPTFSYSSRIPKNDSVYPILNFVYDYLDIKKYPTLRDWRSKNYSAEKMLAATLLAFTDHGYCSLRDFERLCITDIKFIFILEEECPSYKTFQNFLNEALKPCIEDIFLQFNLYVSTISEVDTSVLYVDGTKYEANANKFSFVWMKSVKKYIIQAWAHVVELIIEVNKFSQQNGSDFRFSIFAAPDLFYVFEISRYLYDIVQDRNIQFMYGIGKRKTHVQKMYERSIELIDKLFKYTEYCHIAGNRNSFSKTDLDATFMHMKYDYYCNTGVFKPGYNIQFGICDGYIWNILVSQNANDTKDFIPLIESYFKLYHSYPPSICADAGYGSIENYRYCFSNNILAYIKYSTYQIEKVGARKDMFKACCFAKDEDGVPICPAGHKMILQKETVTSYKGPERTLQSFTTPYCSECEFKKQCTKSAKGRTVTITPELETYKQQVNQLLSSNLGIELLRNRSNQAEGAFGDLKQNYEYNRLVRRGLPNVTMEIYLVAIGFNARKFRNKYIKSQLEIEKEAKAQLCPMKPQVQSDRPEQLLLDLDL